MKPKKKRQPPQIHDSDDEDVEEDYGEVIRPKVKRKSTLIQDSENVFVVVVVVVVVVMVKSESLKK